MAYISIKGLLYYETRRHFKQQGHRGGGGGQLQDATPSYSRRSVGKRHQDRGHDQRHENRATRHGSRHLSRVQYYGHHV